MKTQFKEVAHLYIGCQMTNNTTLYSVNADGKWFLLHNLNRKISAFRPEWDKDVKPILRQIASITDQETEPWNKVQTPVGEMCMESVQQIHWAKRLNYYRSLFMDCDELISNGFAVEL